MKEKNVIEISAYFSSLSCNLMKERFLVFLLRKKNLRFRHMDFFRLQHINSVAIL